jgi:hypothetical protein
LIEILLKLTFSCSDNNLPGFDAAIDNPQNILAMPVWKGFGYAVTYDNTYSNPLYKRFPTNKGWWSDNLQNKDDTLLAGQAVVQDISVNAPDLTTDCWFPIANFTGADGQVTHP